MARRLWLGLIMMTLFGCAAKEDGVTSISGDALARRMAAGESPLVVDVRSGWEFRRGHVPSAVHMPFWKAFSPGLSITDHCDAPVVVYCEHGPRAVIARFALRRAGCDDVIYLQGHMASWREQGLPIETVDPAAK